MALTACSEGNTGGGQTAKPQTEAPDVTPTTEASPQSSGSALGAAEEAGQEDGQEGGQETGGQEWTVGSLVELAKQGKVPGCSYAAHTALYDDIEKAWGKADRNESAGKGMYATYEDKGITFGYNKGMIVFDVRSYAEELHVITLEDIEAALGKADETTVNGSDDIYTYEVNGQFQLKFIIPEAGGGVGHISVFSPQDAKNNMAG
ncbi:YjgB family protein [Paenibacillus sp. N4]|nr:YjgB family protein [Paenibacillus vietnamensis]